MKQQSDASLSMSAGDLVTDALILTIVAEEYRRHGRPTTAAVVQRAARLYAAFADAGGVMA